MTGSRPADPPLVSVVTASLNARDELARTIASVAEQAECDVEHVVVDGGSSDGTVALLESAGETVRWISGPDRGIGDALNKGVAMARGEYILVLQAGDRFCGGDALSHAVERLADRPDLLAFSVLMEERGGKRLVRSRGLGPRSLFHMPMPHQGLIASRDLFRRVGEFDCSYSIAMDYDWLLRARNAGATVQTDARPLSFMPATGISSRRNWADLSRRLAEFRRAQLAHARGTGMRAALHLYWALYPAFRRGRAFLEGRAAR